MRTSDKGMAELISHEAIVPYPYRDSVNVWTFGIGHTKMAGPPDPSHLPAGVRRPTEEVIALFRKDLVKYENDVNRVVKVSLKQHEFDALVSFHFNTGGLPGSHLLSALNAGDHAGAARGFDAWHKPDSIIERRNKEKKLFATGIYSSNGMASIYPANSGGHIQWSQGKRIDVRPYLVSSGGGSSPPNDPPATQSTTQSTSPAPEIPPVATGSATAVVGGVCGTVAIAGTVVAAANTGHWGIAVAVASLAIAALVAFLFLKSRQQ